MADYVILELPVPAGEALLESGEASPFQSERRGDGDVPGLVVSLIGTSVPVMLLTVTRAVASTAATRIVAALQEWWRDRHVDERLRVDVRRRGRRTTFTAEVLTDGDAKALIREIAAAIDSMGTEPPG